MASLLLDACQSWLPSASALLLGHGCQHKSTPVERTNSVYFVSRQRVCPCLSHSINLEQLVKDHNIVFWRKACNPTIIHWSLVLGYTQDRPFVEPTASGVLDSHGRVGYASVIVFAGGSMHAKVPRGTFMPHEQMFLFSCL